MPAVDAMRLLGEELVLDGIPWRNLATFVTTWMEPEAQRIIAENLHRNYIDHAEYPQTAVIEQRCIRMLADLYHAPGETTGTRTQGSSEAIMLGALSLKWKWRARREAAGKPTDRTEPRVRRRRARGVGEVLPLLRRRAAHHPPAAAQVHDRP
jgi:glutamate decarboxylase